MMAEYTPTTETVRAAFARYPNTDVLAPTKRRAAFDRWLAAHEAAANAELRDQLAEAREQRTQIAHRDREANVELGNALAEAQATIEAIRAAWNKHTDWFEFGSEIYAILSAPSSTGGGASNE